MRRKVRTRMGTASLLTRSDNVNKVDLITLLQNPIEIVLMMSFFTHTTHENYRNISEIIVSDRNFLIIRFLILFFRS